MPTINQIKYLDIRALSQYISMSRSYIYQNWAGMVTTHNIRTVRIGKKLLFSREDIDRMMASLQINQGDSHG